MVREEPAELRERQPLALHEVGCRLKFRRLSERKRKKRSEIQSSQSKSCAYEFASGGGGGFLALVETTPAMTAGSNRGRGAVLTMVNLPLLHACAGARR